MKLKNRKVISIASLLFCLIILDQLPAKAQKKDKSKAKASVAVPAAGTTVAPKPATPAPDALKPYEEIIPATAKTSVGFFKVHKVADKYLLEIPDSLLGRELLTVNRISRSAADFRKAESRTVSYAGDMIGESVFNFTKGPANKLFLSVTSYKDRSSDTSANGLSRSLLKSTMQPIISSFAVKAVHQTNKTSVIEITDYINGDNVIFGFSNAKKGLSGLTTPLPDRSYIASVTAFPTNIELKTVKTYQKQDSPLAGMAVYTFEMNSSMLLLPKVPMKVREYDDRIGYLAEEYTDFDLNPRGVKTIGNIQRWRLEPKPEDLEEYHKGHLVEPQKSIVIYIDPSTPKKWVPYLIQGINDWQTAFEKAGFKNAIIGKEAPLNDSTWSIDDARHNVLVYKPAEAAASSGDIVSDPRSGEILEAHISWYHNVLNDLYKSYMVQAGATDPRARTAQFSDELMGRLIRAACSQQIGNKLGLKFNAGASATIPVVDLRKTVWAEANAPSPSIMDFYRYNYVAQPEDHIPANALIPRIGDYDKWAIEWGYRIIPGNHTIVQENEILNKWIEQRLKWSKRNTFGSEPGASGIVDPRNQKDDLGDDAVLASGYGIKNLKRIAPNLLNWTRKPNENYDRAGELYLELINQYERYLQHVANVIGGMYVDAKVNGQSGPVYSFLSREKQQQAMKFLQQEAFSTPLWLKNDALYKLTYTSFNPVMTVQKNTLQLLLDVRCIAKLLSAESYDAAKAYTATQMLSNLQKGVFVELAQHKSITMARRELQKTYVLKLSTMLQAAANADGEYGSVIRAHAKGLLAEISRALPGTGDQLSKAHLEDLKDRLYLTLYNPGALPVPPKKAI
ncbi:MAG: zinc-dependent metalloprotease [Bacteroidota bacterium]